MLSFRDTEMSKTVVALTVSQLQLAGETRLRELTRAAQSALRDSTAL